MSEQSEFLQGLSPEDAIAATNDQVVFGTAMVQVDNGIKRRIPPHEWPYITHGQYSTEIILTCE